MFQVVHVADLPEEIIDDVAVLLAEEEFFDIVPDDLLGDDEFLSTEEPVFEVRPRTVWPLDQDVTLAQDAVLEPAPVVTPAHAA